MARDLFAALSHRQVALGLLPLAVDGRPSVDAARATIAAALDAGVGIIDTADVYGLKTDCPGYAEDLLSPFVAGRGGDGPVVLTKGGLIREPDGARRPNGSPAHLRAACEASLRRLGVDAIDVYQLHRPDPEVPFEESIGALVELVNRGDVRAIGVCNASVAQLRIAASVAGRHLLSVQNELRPDGSVDPVVAEARHQEIVYLAWGVFGGVEGAKRLADRWPEGASIAAARGVSVHQVAVDWALRLGVVPVIGARRPATIVDSVAAVRLDGQLRD